MRWYYYLIFRIYMYYQKTHKYPPDSFYMPNFLISFLWYLILFPVIRFLVILKFDYILPIELVLAIFILFVVVHYFIFMKPSKILNPDFNPSFLGRFFVFYVVIIVTIVGVILATTLR